MIFRHKKQLLAEIAAAYFLIYCNHSTSFPLVLITSITIVSLELNVQDDYTFHCSWQAGTHFRYKNSFIRAFVTNITSAVVEMILSAARRI